MRTTRAVRDMFLVVVAVTIGPGIVTRAAILGLPEEIDVLADLLQLFRYSCYQ